MNKARKILTITALSTMAIAVLMLISAVFGVKIFDFEGVGFKFLLSFAVIAVASAFAINAFNVLKTQKVIAYVSLGLLGLSSLMGIITFWTGFENVVFGKITAILAIATAKEKIITMIS